MTAGGNRIEGLEKISKRWVGNIGWGEGRGAYNIGVLSNPLPTITHKELFWKKDALIV